MTDRAREVVLNSQEDQSALRHATTVHHLEQVSSGDRVSGHFRSMRTKSMNQSDNQGLKTHLPAGEANRELCETVSIPKTMASSLVTKNKT